MAEIVGFQDLPMADMEIGKGQARATRVDHGIGELADSIQKQGLLQPIVVCPGSKSGKYEILIGQRRFLAHQTLQRTTIWAAIMDEPVGEAEAKAISLSENLVREGLSTKDKIDACTWLYKRYGTVSAVVEATGLKNSEVAKYVKYDRLVPTMRAMVDDEGLDVNTALRAQDAAEDNESGKINSTIASALAREMSRMSGANQKRVVEIVKTTPGGSISDALERAKSGERLIQVNVTLGPAVHRGLQRFAEDEEVSQDEAAASLIEESLLTRGLISS